MTDDSAEFDILVVGAGFAGLYALHRLRSAGFRVLAVEAGSGVGGTWFWNRYPGARCDIESLQYCYSFDADLQREWRWTERYAAQPEILRYLDHVADRLDLRRDIRLDTRVTAAHWNEEARHWRIKFEGGEQVMARFCVMATGALSAPKLPDWPGIDRFAGPVFHTAAWPQEPVDFAGKRVGLVGTGSSGIQVTPVVAEQAASLTIFQRTPSFAVPANNRPLDEQTVASVHADYDRLRAEARASFLGFFGQAGEGSAAAAEEAERAAVFERSWNAGTTGLLQAYGDLLIDEASNAHAADFARAKIAALVHDPETARRMTPQGYPIGARRLCSEIGYFSAMNRDNVALVDVRETPIVEVTEDGVRTSERHYPLDMLILATGFHAMVGALAKIDIRGTGGRSLAEEWADGPRSYLGLAVAGFPNLFTVAGPGSPSVLSNVVLSIEQHVDWIGDCLEALRARGTDRIEAGEAAESAWMEHCDAVAATTLFPRANTWYQGRTRDGRQVFMPYVGGVGPYRDRCQAIADAGYEGFLLG